MRIGRRTTGADHGAQRAGLHSPTPASDSERARPRSRTRRHGALRARRHISDAAAGKGTATGSGSAQSPPAKLAAAAGRAARCAGGARPAIRNKDKAQSAKTAARAGMRAQPNDRPEQPTMPAEIFVRPTCRCRCRAGSAAWPNPTRSFFPRCSSISRRCSSLAASSERRPLEDDDEPGREPDPDPVRAVDWATMMDRDSDRNGGRGVVQRSAAAGLLSSSGRCGIRELIGTSSSADESSSYESVCRRVWLGTTAEW